MIFFIIFPPQILVYQQTTMFLQAASLLAVAQAAPYSFVTFGDWGTGSTLQRDCADAVNQYFTTKPYSMVVGLGDSFYNGPLSPNPADDKRWTTEFTDMYTFPVDFYPCMGNHVSAFLSGPSHTLAVCSLTPAPPL